MFKAITDAWIYLNFYLFAFEREFSPASCLLPQLNWIWILNAFCFKSWVMHNPGCYSHFNCHFYHSWRALCVSSHLVVEKQHKTTTPQANMTIERFNLVTFYRNECNGKVRLWKLFGRTFFKTISLCSHCIHSKTQMGIITSFIWSFHSAASKCCWDKRQKSLV